MTSNQILYAIEEERKYREWSKARLANKAGIVLRTYRKWLTGERTPKIESLAPVCKALGLELSVTLKRNGSKYDYSPNNQYD